MKKKIYHWQPELSMAIIYWSCTFGILFISLILTLEKTRPYLVSNITLGFFFLLVALGLNRYFKIGAKYLSVHALFPRRRTKIALQSISTVCVGPRGIELYSSEMKEGSQLFNMTKTNKQAFVEKLKNHPETSCEIIYDPHLKMSRH